MTIVNCSDLTAGQLAGLKLATNGTHPCVTLTLEDGRPLPQHLQPRPEELEVARQLGLDVRDPVKVFKLVASRAPDGPAPAAENAKAVTEAARRVRDQFFPEIPDEDIERPKSAEWPR